jgi:pilus assembly protein CpaE
MSLSEETMRTATQAIFSVCVDEPIVMAATTAALRVPGAVFAGEFQDYITPERRPQFSSFLTNVPSCVALIDYDKNPEMAIKTSERLREIFLRRISIVAIGGSMDANFLLRAMRSGCGEYLLKPVNQADLLEAFKRAQESMPTEAANKRAGEGRVIVLFGAKGGVGTTMLAVHLASYLVRMHGKKVLLIDHKHQLGHVALYLGLKDTRYHFDELLINSDRLDNELLNGFLLRHLSGLEIIASPEVAAGGHRIDRDDLERVIGFLRSQYECVLIDSSLAYQDAAVLLLDQADEIYLVSTPDVAALRDLARLVERLHLNEPGKLNLVINRSTAEDSIQGEQIVKAVRFPITVSIPNNYFELLTALNAGEPIPPQRRSEFNDKLAQWADKILKRGTGDVSGPPKKKGFALWR